MQLAKAPVDDDGGYSLSTYQSGDLYLHTVSRGGEGLSVGSVSKRLTAGGRDEYRVDFELPALGAVLRVIDAASGAPLRATVEQQIELQDGTTYFRQGETNAAGRLELSGYSAGLARLQVHAKSHRAHSIEIPLQDNPEDTIVALERSGSITGRVVDAFGAPIRGARITGGYASETEMNGAFIAATGANGRFSFDSAPDLGTMFYIAAPRHALAITSLHEGENVIVLQPPGSGVVTLRPDNAMPANTYLVLAAPAGGTMIPFGALQDLADVNGMSAYQMQGSQKDGSIVLPQFLGPGKYELFIALQGGKPFLYRRIGTITSPVQQNVVLAYDSK
ncbi:MAG TPA: carboxypeptidase-like regulatory domain-containing protein [Thermoanaerobaculia bacterium]|nr:carboxypeptidase-like regulatory domain-containing protein [Thermoanaerobaculia bacterium]